jgi:hypothetical protein
VRSSVSRLLKPTFLDTTKELIRRLEAGADRVRVKMLLDELRAGSATEVLVGMLPSSGMGATLEAAEAAMLARRGKWGARRGGVRMMVSERDASLLIRNGATLKNDPESAR